MNAFNVNQWAFQMVQDNIRDMNGEAIKIDYYDEDLFEGNLYKSSDRSPENILCSEEELRAAILAANIDAEAIVYFCDLSEEEKITVTSQAENLGYRESSGRDIDDYITIRFREGGGYTVEKFEG